jgi:hypothetical protein
VTLDPELQKKLAPLGRCANFRDRQSVTKRCGRFGFVEAKRVFSPLPAPLDRTLRVTCATRPAKPRIVSERSNLATSSQITIAFPRETAEGFRHLRERLDGQVRARAAGRGLRRPPGLAVYSERPTHFEHLAGPVDGRMLIAAASVALGHRSNAYVWLLERARAEAVASTSGSCAKRNTGHAARFTSARAWPPSGSLCSSMSIDNWISAKAPTVNNRPPPHRWRR